METNARRMKLAALPCNLAEHSLGPAGCPPELKAAAEFQSTLRELRSSLQITGTSTADDGTRTDVLLAQNMISATAFEPDLDALRRASCTQRPECGLLQLDEAIDFAFRGSVPPMDRCATDSRRATAGTCTSSTAMWR